MSQPHTLRLSSWARLVLLSLLLGVGVLASLGLASRPAHAQPAATISVTTCDDATLRGAIANAASGDTITFGCSGTIILTQTLNITKNLTLDGSGQSVTLDGGNSVRVLSVNSGVTFALNALAIAHGASVCQASGGGLFNNGGTVSISNSTFANNSAGECAGGGLFNDGTLSISNSTFANNSAGSGGGLLNFDGTLSIGGSIVAANTGGDCEQLGTLNDQGYNLSSGNSCGFTGTGSLQNTDPKLASALASNGGATQTLALLDGSPAINHIPSSACAVSTDQRGVSRPQGPACDIGAFEFRVPKLSLPSTITANATSSQGAVVSYSATASEPDDASATPSVSCSPASGSTFPVGTTTVKCSASDAANPPDVTSGSFQVVVVDVTPPVLILPANIAVNATSPQGATVNYTVTATDPDNTANQLTISCTPSSGSTFSIGITTVNCSASDPAGNTTTGSFKVVVKDAAAQVNDLITTVNSFHLSSSLQTALDNKLQDALTAINAGQTANACSELTDFIGFVQSHTGKGLTTSQANQLIAAAKQVQAVLGC